MEFNVDKNKALYIKLCNSYIKREGLDKILSMLNRTDFFTAPASMKYHGNSRGGLCFHSIKVFHGLLDLLAMEAHKLGYSIETEVDLVKEGTDSLSCIEVKLEKPIKEVFGEYVTLESLAITGLFHDFHKLNYYEEYEKAIMKGYDDSGKKIWENETHYKVRDNTLVFGLDGTNSNYVISTAMYLGYEERLAIENHMGYISGMGLLPSASKAWTKSRLAVYLHIADMLAAYVEENPMGGK